jgi:hypothetical protein
MSMTKNYAFEIGYFDQDTNEEEFWASLEAEMAHERLTHVPDFDELPPVEWPEIPDR